MGETLIVALMPEILLYFKDSVESIDLMQESCLMQFSKVTTNALKTK